MAEPERLNATRARQGLAGRPVLYVLVGGLALLAVAFVALMSFPSSDKAPPSIGVVPHVQQSDSGQKPTAAEKTGTTSTTPASKPAQ